MFDKEKFKKVATEVVEEGFQKIVGEVTKTLASPFYENIIKSFNLKTENGEFFFSLEVFDEFRAENQDVLRILIYGGVLEKKNKSFVKIPPNTILMKYFS